MKRRIIKPLRREELERMPTKALLGRLKNLYKCEESLELSDLQNDSFDTGVIRFKETREWQIAYEDVKMVLSKREHIPRKG
jgi:hypothetical protein